MNKTLFSIVIACTLSWMGAHAQPIISYDFESKIGSYEEITGGTIILSNESLGNILNSTAFYGPNVEDRTDELKTVTGIPIGFDFTFNDTKMNQFAISGGGFIVFGKDQVTIKPADPYYLFTSSDEGQNNAVASSSLGQTHADIDTEISYKLIGTTGQRVLVIQYKNLGLMSRWQDEVLAKAQMQFRIYEESSKIEIIYKDWKRDDDGMSLNTRTGIKGTIANDLLTLTTSTQNWQDAQPAISEVKEISWDSTFYPADGLTYTFTPAADCETPKNQPTELKLTPTTISLNGEFTAVFGADHYLVILNENESLTSLPVDGKIYNVNDKLGDGTIIAYSTEATFTTPETLTLTGAKKYYIHVFSVNAFCSYGPKYNTNNPLTGNITTLPEPPQTIKVTENNYNEITLGITPNAANNTFIVAITTEYDTNEWGNVLIDGKFGKPTKELKVGDAIEGGGKVIYKGKENSVKVSDLTENTLYHFKAWSIDEQENISSTSVTDNISTWGKVPYIPNFVQMPYYEVPFGWGVEGSDFRLENNYELSCKINQNAAGTTNALTTPWILLKEGMNRVLLDYNMQVPGIRGSAGTAYDDWDERDVFAILVTKDEIKFDTIYRATSKTAMKQEGINTYNRIYAAFDKYAGEKVKVKIYWNCYRGINLFINNIEVEEKLPCDYPINVTASSVVGDKASIGWTSQGEENTWDIRYRIATGDDGIEQEWSNPLEVNANPYLLTGLPTQENIELQVRAKCSLSSQSNWSKSLTFTTGYGIPFTENFSGNALPAGWSCKTGALADPTEFCSGTSCRPQWTWSTRPKGLILSASGVSADEWLIMPTIDLEDGSANYTLNFDIMMLQAVAANDETYSVVISYDGGKTFNSGNVIKTFTKDELPTANQIKTFSVPLNGYKGQIQLALYVKSTTGKASTVQLQKVSIDASCPTDIVATVSDITPESAKVTWTSEAEEFYVFIRKAGETKKQYEKVTVKEKTFDNLDARTAYEIGITKMCAIGDTAKVTLTKFTTLALEPCAQVTNIITTPSQYSVVISWEGEAMKYNIRYRATGTEEWSTKNTTENTLTIEGLEAEKTYEYGIQSVCSEAEGDVSEYTDTASFTTLAITCFPPTNIQVVPTYKSATVTWEGEAENYELGFRKGTEEWSISEITGKTKELTDLDAETTYSVRLRSKCSANDMSTWSSAIEFTTTAIPQCVAPTDLTVTSLTGTSAKLSWSADESNLSWDLRYRTSSATTWINEEGLTVKTYDLTNLTESTAYLWTVKATCDEGRTSAWATQNKFTTEASGINDVAINALKVYVSGNVLNIINTEHCWINNIQIYSLNGQMLYTYTIDSDENILIPMNLHQVKTIIKVNGKDWSKSYPVFFE